MYTIEEALTRYKTWDTERAAAYEREEGDPVSSSTWEGLDDEGTELAHILADLLRQPRKVWTCRVLDRENEEDTVTVHSTEEECWESLRESYDPHGEADDEPPVAIVAFLEANDNLRIDIDVHEI